ncbi:MAG: VPLPA-CTERM-specific exosortase XrtD [Thermodesulfobacteriota bacterium]
MNKRTTSPSMITLVNWPAAIIYLALLAGLFYSTYPFLVRQWEKEDYSYSYLIPLVVLYLIWEKRAELAATPSEPTWKGLIPVLIGLSFYWLGELGGEYYTLYMSSWLLLAGLGWLHLGWRKLKIIAFPLLLILTVFPPPHFIYANLSLRLKLISSQIGVAMIQAYGMSAYREGNVIDLGFTQLQVVDACSGLRFLIPLLVLGIILAYFFRAAWWKRVLMVASTVPLSLITNSLRIAITGILYEVWGAEAAEGFFHGFSGWFIFMFSLAVLLAEMWLLKKLPPRSARPLVAQKTPENQASDVDSPAEPDVDPATASMDTDSGTKDAGWSILPTLLYTKHLPVAVILLASTLALSQGVEFREKVPISKSFSQFPLEVAEWTGYQETMEQKFVVELDLSDYIIVNYRNSQGQVVNFYTAYYQSQRKGESIHSPSSCLPGSGWVFNDAGPVIISLPARYPGGSIKVNRAFMQKDAARQLVYYWFPQRGRILTSPFDLKLYVFWDALTRQRTDGALVRLITSIYEKESLAQAEDRLKSFTRLIVPVLDGFIPGR